MSCKINRMVIERLKVRNFKSFKELDIELNDLNVLIGPNASGKSNFVQIFRFLKDIVCHGLDNAVSLRGGVEYLRNMNIGASKDFYLGLHLKGTFEPFPLSKSMVKIEPYEVIYEFALKFKKRSPRFNVSKDIMRLKCRFIQPKGDKAAPYVETGEITVSRIDNKLRYGISGLTRISVSDGDIFPPFLKKLKLPRSNLLLSIPIIYHPWLSLFDLLLNISIYDIDPKLPKRATPITGKVELEEDGSNLSIVLRNIIKNKAERTKLFNLVKDLLPFIEDLDVEKFAAKSLMFKLRECYFRNEYLPASLISDGTINITALIIALYFERKPLVIIEEPERNIHPYLIAKLMEMIKDASRNKQIILTTHNPEIVKYTEIENLLLVSRDEYGFSRISRPIDREDVKTFLTNEIGIEELYVQNLLS